MGITWLRGLGPRPASLAHNALADSLPDDPTVTVVTKLGPYRQESGSSRTRPVNEPQPNLNDPKGTDMNIARIDTLELARNGQNLAGAIPPLSLIPGDVPLSGIRGMRFERLVAPDRHHRNGLWILL